MERPGNVAIDGPQDEEQLERLRAYAAAGKKDGTHIWAQISHAGRQSNALVNTSPVGPGDIPVCQRTPGSAFSVIGCTMNDRPLFDLVGAQAVLAS
jgi:2,4-dienoyl-CoA reductase-like NADH-dependent reductase (Old Yellow Enzyme family)